MPYLVIPEINKLGQEIDYKFNWGQGENFNFIEIIF